MELRKERRRQRDAQRGQEDLAQRFTPREEVETGNKRDGGDISKVTDYVEQKELDSANASKAIASIVTEVEVDREAERERERELAAVVIEQVRAIHTLAFPPCFPASDMSHGH